VEDVASPRAAGIVVGREYASRAPDDRAALRQIVRARTAADVKAAIDWTVLDDLDPERPVAFWSGFSHGVRQYLVDQAAADGPPVA
jgi:hypothetical protein